MNIEIPDKVKFSSTTRTQGGTNWGAKEEYCFTHAVQRVIKGEKITTEVTTGGYYLHCDDCVREEEGRQM